jgi:hypothetical protein
MHFAVVAALWFPSRRQGSVRHLVNLFGMGRRPLALSSRGPQFAATCTIVVLNTAVVHVLGWAACLICQCDHALLVSLEVRNMGTDDGVISMDLPDRAMPSRAVVLDRVAEFGYLAARTARLTSPTSCLGATSVPCTRETAAPNLGH